MRLVPVRGVAEAVGVGPRDLATLVGAGGKTTLLFRLLNELAARGVRVAGTTTTKLAVPGVGEPPLRCADSWEELVARCGGPLSPAPILGRRVLGGAKVEGVDPDWCDRLVAEGVVEALVVEADGSNRLPLKAPEAWEPVVPLGTTRFLVVAGLSGLGRPLEEVAFRPDRMAAVTGLARGEAVTPAALVRLLLSPDGLAKGLPPGADAVAVLNQADLPGRLEAGWEVARGLLAAPAGYRRVVVASLGRQAPILEAWDR